MDYRKLITLFDGGTEVLLQHNLIDYATIFRDIQHILETDGPNLSDATLRRFVSIFMCIRNRVKDNEDGEQI